MTDSVRILARDVFGNGQWTEWNNPFEILTAAGSDEVPSVLKRVEEANSNSRFALGFVSYEAGPAFEKRFVSRKLQSALPYAWFAIFDAFTEYTPEAQNVNRDVTWESSVNRSAYRRKIDRIKECIASGETYQVNYTFKLKTKDRIDAASWFHELYSRQPTPYAMLIETSSFSVVSISPELFFRRDGDRIICEPMKGTCPRGPHPALDAVRGEELKASRKNRAENVMIVDMVRNDLSRIANASSISVDELFKVSPWPTLWQMTSTVSATVKAGLGEIFRELFPSASITGAPKLHTSRIIAELEEEARGIYTGAIGWSLPGRKAQFAVAIRTAAQDKAAGITEYGVGSGIVWDSEADSEFEECNLKAKLLSREEENFCLLETLRWDRGTGYRFLAGHLERLTAASEYFGFSVDPKNVMNALEEKANTFTTASVRVRLLVDRTGGVTLEDSEITVAANYDHAECAVTFSACIDPSRNPVDSPFLYHKTTNRKFYDDARARNRDVDEVLLINDHDEAMEFTTGNIVIRKGDQWLTPVISSGLLPGVFRNHLIDTGRIKESVIPLDKIKTADEIYFINSVRGWIRVKLQ